MDEPVYKLSSLRHAYGLSENGFRLYERMGLVHCERNQENGYRTVTLSEGVRLAGSYDLVRAGFTIRQVNELIDQPLGDYAACLDEACAAMGRQIQGMTIRKARLEQRVRLIRQFEAAPEAIHLAKTDAATCFLPIHDKDLSFSRASYDDAAAWNQAFPLTNVSLVVELGEDRTVKNIVFGSSANHEDAVAYGLPLQHAEEFCASGIPCLRAFVRYPSSQLPNAETYRRIFEYLAAQGLHMRGGRILHTLLDLTDRTHTTRLDEVLVPLMDEG